MTRPELESSASEAAQTKQLLAAVDRRAPEALALAHWMTANPELALEERGASARYRALLGPSGFDVEAGSAGLETAFVGSRGRSDAPLRVALLAEMDALPDIGHACGHNLSGPASLLAAVALAEVIAPEALHLLVVGCPAEEIGVGKRRLVEAGVFEGVHAALMAHASDMRRAHRLFLGNRKVEFVFHGRAAHAAAYPEQGINALDGVVQLLVGIGLLRQQLPRTARIHAIVTDGGRAPNVIPERAAARVWVRALDASTLDHVAERVQACARGAAEATGTMLERIDLCGSSPPMRPNAALADAYRRQLERLGLAETEHAPDANIGSSDVTHVSWAVPTIHPNFPIGSSLELHTRAFADATASPEGEAGMLEAARALALTVAELVRSRRVREAVAAAHAAAP
ncbi:MAG: amidohydrolase [Deltaproteobacteria bacterium]|nr:amidohydrolase [Deltaproteobacteria bacterium]